MMAAAERFLQLHQLCDRTSTPDRTRVFEDGSNTGRDNVNSSSSSVWQYPSQASYHADCPSTR